MMMNVNLALLSLLGFGLMSVNCQGPVNASSPTCGSPKTVTVLRSQAEVNALSRCTLVAGSLALNGTGISDLKPLQSLRRIEASLEIIGTGLQTLGGLGSLAALGESLVIHDNLLLETLGGLEALVNVSGGIAIHENPLLRSVEGLSKLSVRSSRAMVVPHYLKYSQCGHSW